ncbi:MAG: serine protease [Desulfobacterales bacterium]
MKIEDLKSYDPELLLQELRARESKEVKAKELFKAFPCGRMPGAKASISGGMQSIADLKGVDSKELIQALRFQQKVIYGTDDRKDMYSVSDTAIRTDADSVVALVDSGSIADNGDGTSTLSGDTFAVRYTLCESEPFRLQPCVAFCSGFLVDPSMVATAAHCVENDTIDTIRFVFGLEMIDPDTPNTTIANSEIYQGRRILGRQIGIQGTDWALVQLDRPVRNHPYVRIRRSGQIPDGTALHVIGHPVGLPKKYAPGANVRENNEARYFVANLDTYGGNSGSAVFNAANHVVEGILVRGETDFVWNGDCRVSNVCPANGCRGEDCTRTTEFDNLVPHNEHDIIPFNPAKAQALEVGGRWKIVVSDMWLLDFGTNKGEAEQALKVITHYGLNSQCFVGRPHPSMEFYLVDGESPTGALTGEDAIPMDPAKVEVQYVRGRWKLVEEDHWIMDFDQSEREARQALSYVLYYGFRYICYVGRPDPSMTYFRK